MKKLLVWLKVQPPYILENCNRCSLCEVALIGCCHVALCWLVETITLSVLTGSGVTQKFCCWAWKVFIWCYQDSDMHLSSRLTPVMIRYALVADEFIKHTQLTSLQQSSSQTYSIWTMALVLWKFMLRPTVVPFSQRTGDMFYSRSYVRIK